jgi:hypothetical protein
MNKLWIKNNYNPPASQKNFLSLSGVIPETTCIMNYKEFPYYQRTTLEMIFNDTYEIYRRHFGWLFFFSFLFLIIMQPLTGYLIADKMNNLDQVLEDPEAMISFYKGMSLYFLIFMLTYTYIYLFLTCFVITRTYDPDTSIAAIAGRAFTKYYIRFLFIGIISYFIIVFGSVIGLLALIVGAFVAFIFLAVSLSMVLPVLVVEDTGIFETIGRSFRLVLKDFWTILGYLIIFMLVVSLMSIIFNAISMAPYASSFIRSLFGTASAEPQATFGTFHLLTKPLYVILNSFFSALLLPLTPIFLSLIYFHLRYVEDEKAANTQEIEQL